MKKVSVSASAEILKALKDASKSLLQLKIKKKLGSEFSFKDYKEAKLKISKIARG